jgi:hypothetical protein
MFRFNGSELATKLEDLFKREGYLLSGPQVAEQNRDSRTAYRLTDEGKLHKEKIRPYIEPQDSELFDCL